MLLNFKSLKLSDYVKNSSSRAELFFWAGKIYQKLNLTGKSIIYFQQSLSNDAQHYGANLYLGNIMVELNAGERSAVHFETCI
jgi:hypothetical protein